MKINAKLIFSLFFIIQIIKSLEEEDHSVVLFGFGSPIVDGVVDYHNIPELAKEIKRRLSYHMSEDFPVDFYQEVFKHENTSILLGGSAMNTIRITNHFLKLLSENDNAKVAFIGSTGKDEYADFINKGLTEEGIIFHNEVYENMRTSTCIVLVKYLERSFYSDLGSSEKISLEFFKQLSDRIRRSKIFYADAYLIGKRFDSYKYIYETFSKENITMILSLGSENIVRDFQKNIEEILPHLDVIFVNKEEINMLRNNYGVPELTDEEFLSYFSKRFDKVNKQKNRVIVNTRGKNITLLYSHDLENNIEKLYHIPIFKIKKKNIIDLNGAGDGFSGGYVAGILLGYDEVQSTKIGHRIASEVIQMKGFQIPKHLTKNDILRSIQEDIMKVDL